MSRPFMHLGCGSRLVQVAPLATTAASEAAPIRIFKGGQEHGKKAAGNVKVRVLPSFYSRSHCLFTDHAHSKCDSEAFAQA